MDRDTYHSTIYDAQTMELEEAAVRMKIIELDSINAEKPKLKCKYSYLSTSW